MMCIYIYTYWHTYIHNITLLHIISHYFTLHCIALHRITLHLHTLHYIHIIYIYKSDDNWSIETMTIDLNLYQHWWQMMCVDSGLYFSFCIKKRLRGKICYVYTPVASTPLPPLLLPLPVPEPGPKCFFHGKRVMINRITLGVPYFQTNPCLFKSFARNAANTIETWCCESQ